MSIVKFLLPLALALATCWAGNPIFERVDPQPFDYVPPGYRLPSVIKPINYNILLEPHLNVDDKNLKFTFNGVSTITLDINTKFGTNNITFHAKELKITDMKFTYEIIKNKTRGNWEKESITINGRIFDTEKDFVTLKLEKKIPIPGARNYVLTLNYIGELNDKLRGFYRSSYQDEHKNTRWLATTHFEPVGARLAFPCWDEPAIKATFDISIKHPSDYTAISNMHAKSEKSDINNKKLTIFERTPMMSTYLVAFLVSDYERKSINNNNTFNVWTRPQAINSTSYALDIGQSILTELEDFTGYKYKDQKMTKMDQVTIPQFSPGAMENWGIVMYREPALLYTENVTTTQNKQGIASVIAHEFSHQWFGNLVSPKWWEYIWLNEGFATFFQYYTTEKVIEKRVLEKKESASWRLMDQFVIKNLQASAFVTDAGLKTRPMNYDAATSAQINSLFDDIAYKKAAAVIRMMQHFLTEEHFKKGLETYLKS